MAATSPPQSGPSASADLYRHARRVLDAARIAVECATPGPRRDCARARAKLAEVARLAGEGSQ